MKPILLITMVAALAASPALAQRQAPNLQTQREDFLNAVKMKVKPENLKAEYADRDFSTLIIPKDEFLGYIGPDYKRIRMHYTSVTRDPVYPDRYLISGVSIVEGNKCNFSGTARITGVYELKSMQYGVDSMYKDAGFRAQGIALAEYELRENPEQSHPGVFKGTMAINWLVDRDDLLVSNHVERWYSDNFCDNQHAGIWTAYGQQYPKVCNWGMYRIPFSGDLDMGAAEFSPNPKYDLRGWADHQ